MKRSATCIYIGSLLFIVYLDALQKARKRGSVKTLNGFPFPYMGDSRGQEYREKVLIAILHG